MLKGGTVVSMQSLLARLPHGTKVITSNSADGNSNVYVVGNVLTQVQNQSNKPKHDGTTSVQKGPSSTASTGQTVKSTAVPRGSAVSMSAPTSAVQTAVSNQGTGTIRVVNTTQGAQLVTQGGKLVTQTAPKQQSLPQGAQKANLPQQLIAQVIQQQKPQVAQQSTSQLVQQQNKTQSTHVALQKQLQSTQVAQKVDQTQVSQSGDTAIQQQVTKTSESKPT